MYRIYWVRAPYKANKNKFHEDPLRNSHSNFIGYLMIHKKETDYVHWEAKKKKPSNCINHYFLAMWPHKSKSKVSIECNVLYPIHDFNECRSKEGNMRSKSTLLLSWSAEKKPSSNGVIPNNLLKEKVKLKLVNQSSKHTLPERRGQCHI